MATKIVLLSALVLSLLAVQAVAADINPTLGCAKNPAVVAACFSVEGRVGVYDGSPVVRIRPKGSRRLLGVLPSEQEIMPDDLKKAIGLDTDALARMTVCPFSKREPGRMQYVCVESARDIRSVPRR